MPNKLLHRLHGGDQGALSISFNNSGSILAVACSNNDVTFPIRLYDTESGMLRHEFVGHHSLVYDLKFSMNDKYLVSASADGTSKVFCMGGLSSNKRGSDEGELEDGADEEDEDGEEGDDQEEEEEEDASSLMGKKKKRAKKGKDKDKDGETLRGSPFLMSTLQHNPPVYLYCATFQPPAPSAKGNDNSAPLVLTGSFDSAIRLWNPTTGSNLGLTGGKRYHESNVNAMVFDHKTGRLYSGDGEGCIIIWRKQGQGKAGTDYAVMRKIDKLKELKGVPITSLALDPSRPTGRGQILIMGHNNTMKVFDLSTQRLTSSSYAGADNHKSIVRASYSACGKYVVAGSDQGTLMVWDAKTGELSNSTRMASTYFFIMCPLPDNIKAISNTINTNFHATRSALCRAQDQQQLGLRDLRFADQWGRVASHPTYCGRVLLRWSLSRSAVLGGQGPHETHCRHRLWGGWGRRRGGRWRRGR